MNTDILPLAITMMAGPQIMSAIIFVTSERALATSLAFVAGVLAATTTGVAILLGVHSLLGDSLILVMPSDVIVMLTVATNLEQNGHGLGDAVPFILLTALIAALPLLGYLLFHRRAVSAMPALRDWMNANSWLVNIIVCAIFIVLIL
jgi:Sap, sulfolipid-1-addressing protein